jgi:hypothetical protein
MNNERLPATKWIPINDGFGIIGYSWECDCGETLNFASCGDTCDNCGFQIPDVDPDKWHDNQMKLPIMDRDWNRQNE